LATAQVAAVQACKRCADWIPMAHPLPLTSVDVGWTRHPEAKILEIEVEVGVTARTGAEMEALTGVSCGLLTVYDMLKAVDRAMILGPIWLAKKQGGVGGSLQFDDPPLD
jgi:cyclic pyranopterin phosphate synthase